MTQSAQLFANAQSLLPGGVSSPVRAFNSVDMQPLFIKQGHGPYIVDVEGREYIDYVCSWGPLIAGHAHPYVIEKVSERIQKGVSFGAPTEIELELAQKVISFMPSIEKIRFVSSGTEAAMSAIRVARGFTGRNKIIKFAGCYHGHSDSLLVAAGSGALTHNVPSSAGVPESVVQHTLIADFNNLDQVEALFNQHADDIAAIVVEPVAGNMNLVLPKPGFLQGLRKLCDRHHSLLLFDEVMTGFRVAKDGAQGYFQVKPDLTVLGKIVGGGFPAAAFGGRKDVMDVIAPLGPVYQAGTLSGNPVAMTAGLATLELVEAPEFYSALSSKTEKLVQGLQQAADKAGVALKTKAIGGMFGIFFTDKQAIENEADAKACNIQQFKQFFAAMLEQGVYLAPSAFEAGFVSSVHEDAEINRTIEAAKQSFNCIS